MHKLRIPYDTLILVGDGRKALVLRNDGDEKFPNLATERVFATENLPAHGAGSDAPGRASRPPVLTRAAALAIPTGTSLTRTGLPTRSPPALECVVRERNTKALIIVAPPKTLADLRSALHADLKSRVIAEIDRDLTHHPVYDIEKHLAG